jgi:hypothetical protein
MKDPQDAKHDESQVFDQHNFKHVIQEKSETANSAIDKSVEVIE